MPSGKPNAPKGKPGPKSYKDQAVCPKGARINKKIRFALNKKRDNKTLATDRYGFGTMWRHAPAEMRAGKIGRKGSFEKGNIHKGIMWGWKHECNMTNEKAKRILFRLIHCGKLTKPMLEAVRKSLSYSYQLVHCDRSDFPQQRILYNWPAVFTVWKTLDKKTLKPVTPETSTLPDRIPTYDENKTAFTTGWTPDHPWTFLQFTAGCQAAFDSFVCGPRPETDIGRIKKSRDHVVVPGEGQMSTGYDGGRAKTDVETPWRLWTVCFCPGKHVSPGRFDRWLLVNGNPRNPFNWCSTCPLACHEFLQSFPNAKGKRYCKVNKHGTDITKTNEGDVVTFATDWMVSQGVCPADNRYSHNSGRRSLARLLSKSKCTYAEGFEIHADKWQNWSRYQPDCAWSSFDRRQQALDPDTACCALRKIARKFGRGVKVKVPLDMTSRYVHNLMKMCGHGAKADRIREGFSSSDEEEDGIKREVHPISIQRMLAADTLITPIDIPPKLEVPLPKLEVPLPKKLTLGEKLLLLKPVPVNAGATDWAAMDMPPLPAPPKFTANAKRLMTEREVHFGGPISRRSNPFELGPMPLPPKGKSTGTLFGIPRPKKRKRQTRTRTSKKKRKRAPRKKRKP